MSVPDIDDKVVAIVNSSSVCATSLCIGTVCGIGCDTLEMSTDTSSIILRILVGGRAAKSKPFSSALEALSPTLSDMVPFRVEV